MSYRRMPSMVGAPIEMNAKFGTHTLTNGRHYCVLTTGGKNRINPEYLCTRTAIRSISLISSDTVEPSAKYCTYLCSVYFFPLHVSQININCQLMFIYMRLCANLLFRTLLCAILLLRALLCANLLLFST